MPLQLCSPKFLGYMGIYGRNKYVGGCCLLHNLLLVDVVGPPSAEVCRTVANFPQVDDLRFINPWEA